MSDILDDTAKALYSVLQGGTALTALLSGTTAIYNQEAPDGAAYPIVIFNFQGGGPELLTSKQIEGNLWAVRAISTESATAAAAIFAQVDALLDKKNIAISNHLVFWCAREENISMVPRAPNNLRHFHRGGVYRIRTTGG